MSLDAAMVFLNSPITISSLAVGMESFGVKFRPNWALFWPFSGRKPPKIGSLDNLTPKTEEESPYRPFFGRSVAKLCY
jgi:hypothetical protein